MPKIEVVVDGRSHDSSTPEERARLEAYVDEDIVEFDRFFQSIQRPENRVALIGVERAAIKTYLAYKLGLKPASSA